MPIRITSLTRREDTIVRLGGSGDNFPMTWAADDRLLVSVTDGYGWHDDPPGRYSARIWAIEGGPEDATFHDLAGYPDLFQYPHDPENYCRYLGYGVLAVDGCIYQFLHALNHPPRVWLDSKAIGAKLIYSPDNGVTWHNQDGSTPVAWEDWYDRSRKNMVFYREPQDAFSFLTFVQMGRGYEANRDGYVYVYSPNGNYDGSMNQLVLFRVPKQRLLQRVAYEFFAGPRPDGTASWTREIEAREVVHTFPAGWVNKAVHLVDDLPYTWLPSIVYNPPLDTYLMVSWGMGVGANGLYFARPSYLGFWTAPSPWGPWTQIHEETAWMPGGDAGAYAYCPQIAPKWISEDGTSFWLVWADAKGVWEYLDAYLKMMAEVKENPDAYEDVEAEYRRQRNEMLPYYGFNAQRVDLVVE